MPRPKKQTLRQKRLAELYNQLQAATAVLEKIVQPGEVREAAQSYTPSSGQDDPAAPRYRFEERGKEAWTVLDRQGGDALLAITRYKKGAEALIERLEAYERRLAELSHTSPLPPCPGDSPSPPTPT
jgi:hypothetical protein